MKIVDLKAKEILDSKGDPTLEVLLTLENGARVVSKAPSGASTATTEAVELRDGDLSRYKGRGVLKAVANVNTVIKQLLVNQKAEEQQKIDDLLIAADGTTNKAKLGGNAMVATSMAVCRAGARAQNLPLYGYLGQLLGNKKFILPEPLILLLEGGKHGDWATDVQEYLVIPKKDKFPTFANCLDVARKIFSTLEQILKEKGYNTSLGFEGAYCPPEIKSNEEAFQLMIAAVEKSGYRMGEQVVLGMDAAASEFFINGNYVLKSENNKQLTSQEWSNKILDWTKKYPILCLEDIFDQEDWPSWSKFNTQLAIGQLLVGDDLLTTNIERIKKAIKLKAVNSVLIKPNQIGTVSETLAAIKLAHEAGFTTVVSHRGGETDDDFIADLVVGAGSRYCKFGGPTKIERVVKYNRLLKIETELNQ
jgi:enolase